MNPQNINKLKTELAAKEAKYGELCKIRNPIFDEEAQKLAEEIVALKTDIRDTHIENLTRRANPEEFFTPDPQYKGPATDEEEIRTVFDAASEELRQNPDTFKKEPRP